MSTLPSTDNVEVAVIATAQYLADKVWSEGQFQASPEKNLDELCALFKKAYKFVLEVTTRD